MIFSEKLQLLRKSRGFTQETFALQLNVSRQAVAKWESGQAYPDISNLIQISHLLNVTIDHLVKDQECSLSPQNAACNDLDEIIHFRLEAGVHTYAAQSNQTSSTRFDSHDYRYVRDPYAYHDTYVGGEQFAGQEVIAKHGKAVYAMNYAGRVLSERFSGHFLKEALRKADYTMPYRWPAHYQAGEFLYQSRVTGDFEWFQGYEEIFCQNEKVYECYYHGGLVRT